MEKKREISDQMKEPENEKREARTSEVEVSEVVVCGLVERLLSAKSDPTGEQYVPSSPGESNISSVQKLIRAQRRLQRPAVFLPSPVRSGICGGQPGQKK